MSPLNLHKAVDKGDGGENEKFVLQNVNQKDFNAISEGSLNTPGNVHTPKNLGSCTGRYPTHLFNQANIGNVGVLFIKFRLY